MRYFTQKNVLIFTFVLSVSHFVSSQNTQPNSNNFWKHVRIGGGIGMSFGDGFFSGTLAPSAIYDFNDQFALGVGLNGTYNSRKNFYKSTIVGGSVLGLFNPIREIQLSAEFEELNVSRKWEDQLEVEDQNYWYPALFIGAGYRAQNITIGIRYDVLYDKNRSIYGEAWVPFVRVYF